MLVALDSTDSLRGGCTTHVALEIWQRLAEYDCLGAPRLVRLNPNIPFKTRGNGALCLVLGHGRGRRRTIGQRGRVELKAAESIEEPSAREADGIRRVAAETIEELHARDDEKSQPGLVCASSRPPAGRYWKAVQDLVVDIEQWVPPGAWTKSWNGGRGLVGAVAAAAWPARRGTFELVAYRDPRRWGTVRDLDPQIGPELDRRFASTFDNWDPKHRHLRIAPRSPCPILAGIRGTDPSQLLRSHELLGPERPDAWLLYATNQGTGDHLRARRVADLGRFQSAVLVGEVVGPPRTMPGGHVFLRLRDGSGECVLAAYEPTKDLRGFVRTLRSGDVVRAEASTHADPLQLSMEGIELLQDGRELAFEPPTCGPCGAATKSRGRRAGYRCRRCGRAYETGMGVPLGRKERLPGRVTVPICVRRHLARPNGLAEEFLRLAPLWGSAS